MSRWAPADAFSHSCRCGATRLTIKVPAASAGTRVRCYCGDCQTAARLHDPDQDLLSAAGGTDIWHTTPDRIEIETGASMLKISQLSPRGGFRWYAGCCGALMCSTARNLKIPFVSVTLRQPELATVSDLLGPVRCHAFAASALSHPQAPKASAGVVRAVVLGLKRAALALLSGRARTNPLRRSDGTAIAPVDVISVETRRAARPDHLK